MAAVDQFPYRDLGITKSHMDWPATRAAAVTPHDTNELDCVTRGIFVGTGGDLAVVMADDSAAVTFTNVPNGTILPIRVKQVLDTGTDADDILALY